MFTLFANIAAVVAKQVNAGVNTTSSSSLNPGHFGRAFLFLSNLNANVSPAVAEFKVNM